MNAEYFSMMHGYCYWPRERLLLAAEGTSEEEYGGLRLHLRRSEPHPDAPLAAEAISTARSLSETLAGLIQEDRGADARDSRPSFGRNQWQLDA
jgi:hypothetical protein